MREFGLPATYTIPVDVCMADAVTRRAADHPHAVCFLLPDGDNAWTELTVASFAEQVRAVAKGLIASGVQVGDRIALMCATRYEWILLDYAIWFAGGVTVAVYATSSAEQLRWILADSAASMLIVENALHQRTAQNAVPEINDVPVVLQIDRGAVDTLAGRGTVVPDSELDVRRRQIGADSEAVLIYTSGTTGRPKGVPVTHGNLAALAASARTRVPELIAPGSRTLLFLPLAHSLAHAISLVAFESGVVVAHTSDWSRLTEQFGVIHPTSVFGVPRVFEKLYNTAEQRARDAGRGRLFDRAAEVAIAYSRAQDTGGPGLRLRLEHAVFDRLVYQRLRAALGGRCRHALSGGAPLGARLAHFFRGAGISIAEGYGLTETAAAITVNGHRPDDQRLGTVGRPFPGHDVRVAEDGELLVRGPVVFEGYLHNPAATAASFTDGWFHTGDLAAIDEDGFVTITGRKKEIIVTAGGKNVSPAALEDSLRAHPLISQCMVVGDAKPFIAALVTLDRDALPGWRTRHGIDAQTPAAQLISNPVLTAEIASAVAQANTRVSKAEQIRKFRIVDAEWSQETGELTPKLSLKRTAVLARHEDEIDALYH